MRILVIRYRYLGDTVLAIPFLRNLRAAYPEAVIDVLVEPRAGDVLSHCPYPDELIVWYRKRPKPGAAYPECYGHLAAAKFLRGRNYDKVYILRRAFSTVLLPLLAGIPGRIGFAWQGTGPLLTRKTAYADQHEVECFLDLLRADSVPVKDAHNENWSDPVTDRRVAEALPASGRKRIFFCAKSTDLRKDWSTDRFAQLLSWLIAERQAEIHFCDSPGNTSYYAEILAGLTMDQRGHCHDWSRQLSIQEMNSLVRRMDLALGIDTGLVHVAASFHVPVLALFGPPPPWRWHPWDTPYTLIRPDNLSGPQPLLRVSVAEVQQVFDNFLATFPVPKV